MESQLSFTSIHHARSCIQNHLKLPLSITLPTTATTATHTTLLGAAHLKQPYLVLLISNMALPTKDVFLSNLEVFSQCSICLQAIDTAEHVAVRTSCQHVFGKSCLTKWIESSQANSAACPVCRTVLFVKPLTPPRFIIGRPRANDTCYIGKYILKMLEELWVRCYYLKDRAEISEFTLEAHVTAAMRDASGNKGSWLWTGYMNVMVELAKEMIIEICGNPTKTIMRPEDRDEKWLPKFAHSLGLVVLADDQDVLPARFPQ